MKFLRYGWGALCLVVTVLSFAKPELFAVAGVQLAALAAFSGAGSYDLGGPTQGANLDLSQELHAILLADTMLLGRIGSGGTIQNVDHYWVEESLNATYVTLAEGAEFSAGDTTMTVATGDGAKVPIGSLLVNESEIGKDEVIQVTAVSSDNLTVTRNAGDSGNGATAHADGSRFRIIAQAKQEGDENVTDRSVARVRKHNVCQIFKREVFVSGTMQAVNMAGVPKEYEHQLGRRLIEVGKRELAQSVWAGVKITNGGTGGSDTVYRAMGGIRQFIKANASQLYSAAASFSEDLINDELYKRIYDKGGEASVAVGNADRMKKFSTTHADKVRYAPSDKTRGVFVTKYLTSYGVELDLLVDRWCLPGDLALLDPSRIKLLWLRAMQATPLAQQGDALRGMIVGECTLEVQNAAECFALATNIS